MTSVADLDKVVETRITEGYGAISIRVVVLQKKMGASAAPTAAQEVPIDASPDEQLPDADKRPTSTFLEDPRRGRQVCVFLINGQRQHAWDNQFIVRDLELKYLRNRMITIVDCDALNPEAIADLMQGSRAQFYEGKVYSALESRVLATLKDDPDLRRLEEDAEDDIASLEAGDEAVKSTLDQLIESHHEAAEHTDHGHTEVGTESRDEGVGGSLLQTQTVVVEADASLGVAGSEPVLQLRPDLATIRLKPNEGRRFLVSARPEGAWKKLESMALTFDPPVRELQVTRSSQLAGEEVTLLFAEPDDFDADEQYPIETVARATATFAGSQEYRLLERRVVITKKRQWPPVPPKPLKDDPTYIRVTSRQPIKILIGGADLHVKLRWDGKDELAAGNPPPWIFRVSCESPSVEPQTFLTRPTEGRFELLIQAVSGLTVGEQLKFDVEAIGPGKTLATAFLVDVAEPPSPRRISVKLAGGAQRRPPYALVYVKRENWNNNDNNFGEPWTGNDAGSYDPPDPKSPLTIFINVDMDLLATYRDSLLAKKHAESTIQQRINKYTAHVAFHLYQMYQKKKQAESQLGEVPSDFIQRDEIQRVAHTLIRLMEVMQ